MADQKATLPADYFHIDESCALHVPTIQRFTTNLKPYILENLHLPNDFEQKQTVIFFMTSTTRGK